MSSILRGILAKPGRLLIAAAVLVLGLTGLLSSGFSSGGAAALIESMMEFQRGAGFTGLFLFFVLQVLVVLSGAVPNSLLGVAAGALYGLGSGFSLAAVGSLLGAILAFGLSRSLFRSAIERILSRHGRLHSLDLSVSQDGWKLVFLLRLSPIMPFSATSYLLGLSSVSLPHYVAGTLASMPALFGCVFLGTLTDAGLSAGAGEDNLFRCILLGSGAVATLLLVVYLGRLVLRRHVPAELLVTPQATL